MNTETFALIVAIAALLISILGWATTYLYQTKILERQKKAEEDIKKLDVAHQLALSNRQFILDVLPVAREKMLETYGRIVYLHRPAVEYPDFATWSEPQLNDWVRSLEFTSFQKATLMMADDKEKYYLETQFEYDLQKAQYSLDDFHNFLLFKKPLIDPPLFTEFGAIETLFEQGLNGIAFARRSHEKSAEQQFVAEFMSQADTLIGKIEEMIKEQINK